MALTKPDNDRGGMPRAVISDDPSRAIMLAAYAKDGRAIALPVSPVRALGIARGSRRRNGAWTDPSVVGTSGNGVAILLGHQLGMPDFDRPLFQILGDVVKVARC
jgi:hypothetical protein